MENDNTADVFKTLSDEEETLAKELVNIAFAIHKTRGPGLLESIYEKCFCYELTKRSIPFVRQEAVDIRYEKLVIEQALKIDVLVGELIVVELKAQENFHPVWQAQLLSYLKLTGCRLGFILNFHVPLMKNGRKRIIL